MKFFALLGAVLFTVVACGTSDHGMVIDDSGGGRTGSAGRSGSSAGNSGKGGEAGVGDGLGEGGEAGATNAAAPIVSVLSPTEVTDPNDGAVVLDKVHVLCSVTKGTSAGASLSVASVAVEAFDATGKSLQKIAGTQNNKDATQFFADFVLSAATVPNGAISFKCSAADLSTPANVGSDRVRTFIDHGPTIAVTTPTIPTTANVLDYYALSTGVPFRFSVAPAPLSTADAQADVQDVTLTVDNEPIDLSAAEDPKNPGSYKVDLRLDDTTKFKSTPTGPVPVKITATNKRSATLAGDSKPVTATTEYNFGIDAAGPVITIVSPPPLNAPVVGVSVKLQFTVTDAQSGVDPSTVSVVLDGKTKIFDAANPSWTRSGDTYTYNIVNTTQLGGSPIQLTVSISAKDLSKNTALAATAEYWLDTTPPIVDLDPPAIEELKPGTGNGMYCSDPFDPVGPDSPSEGDMISDATIYRALVWDETNSILNQPVLHFATIDPASVRLYAQDNPAQPLLIDTDGDNHCDALAIAGTQGVTDPPTPVELHSLDAAGTATYSTSSPIVGGCTDVASNGSPVLGLCTAHNSHMTRVIDHALSGAKENVIYTDTSAIADECTGKVTALSSSLNDGWVCLAAEATDRAGNHAISAPIRACFHADGHPVPACANSSVDKPSCTSGCIPPGHFPYAAVSRLN